MIMHATGFTPASRSSLELSWSGLALNYSALPALPDRPRRLQHRRRIRAAVEPDGVLEVDLDSGRKHDAVLRRARENVARIVGAPRKPVRIVERAGAEPEEIRKALEIEIERGGAAATEIQRDALVAPVGAVVVGLRRNAREGDVLPAEDRLDQKRRAGEALAERAMADRDP